MRSLLTILVNLTQATLDARKKEQTYPMTLDRCLGAKPAFFFLNNHLIQVTFGQCHTFCVKRSVKVDIGKTSLVENVIRARSY